MKIVSIEPTPSPNTMKINLDEELPMGKSHNYKKEDKDGAPEIIKKILSIDGIKGVYHVADFLAVERNAKFDWQDLLYQVRKAFGEEGIEDSGEGKIADQHFGEVKVQVQMFKGIPLQVKLTGSEGEKRFGMPEMYTKAVGEVQRAEDNYIYLREWKDFGVRYGDMEQIGNEVVEELIALYPEDRLNRLIKAGKEKTFVPEQRKRIKLKLEDLDQTDWRKRYQLLEQMEDPTLEDLPLLEKALNDEKASIRRLATVYLGMIEDKKVLPLLYKALKDKTVSVRRTAGDCLSDLGFKEAMREMAEALKDESKLVRWRAAMFLYETGDESVLPSLKEAENDPEFEVKMQVKMAIERIEKGEEAKGSVWKQMTEARKK